MSRLQPLHVACGLCVWMATIAMEMSHVHIAKSEVRLYSSDHPNQLIQLKLEKLQVSQEGFCPVALFLV